MFGKRFSRALVVAATASLVMASVAFADNVKNDITTVAAERPVEVTLPASGLTTTFEVAFILEATGTSCNVSASSPQTMGFSGLPAGVSATAGTVFSSCGTWQDVTFTVTDAASTGNSVITPVMPAAGNGWNCVLCDFTLKLTAATVTNNAPVITEATFDPATVSCGTDNATLKVTWTDDPGDTHSVSVDWGDLSALQTFAAPQASPFQASHTYASAGPYTATVTVTDQGGLFDTDTANVSVLYNTSGILQPINADGTSGFKIGQTIPVKAVFTDCDGSLPSSNPTVHLKKVSNGTGEVVDEVVSSSAADTGNQMRYSTDGEQFIFNLSTKKSQFNGGKDLTEGRYELTIKIGSVTQITVQFGLRK